MRTIFVAGTVLTILMGPALAQVGGQPAMRPPQAVPGKPQPVPGKPGTSAKPAAQSAKPAPAVASTPEARSAAELALTSDPVFDDGTYLRIKQTLLSYSDIQVRGGWPMLPADAKLAPGASGPEVALLRKRLVITEDLPAGEEAGDSYDAAVVAGVKKFQLRHGLDATGTVGAQTLKALNVPVGDRIKQLEASLERLLGMDFLFAERYVVVNIPAAFVEAVAHGKVERRYRVIVGKIDKPSPTLTAYITAVDLNPTWTVPLSITKTEIANHMRKDPSYLSRMHMRLLGAHDEEINPGSVDWSMGRSPNFTVRQDAGTWNALGNLKIDMPNPYSVYMHDTDTRKLFSRRLPLRFPRLHARRQCARSRRLDSAGRSRGLGSRLDRCRHRRRPDQDHQPAAQDSGGLGLSHRLGAARRHRRVPRRRLQARRVARPQRAGRCRGRRLRRAGAEECRAGVQSRQPLTRDRAS